MQWYLEAQWKTSVILINYMFRYDIIDVMLSGFLPIRGHEIAYDEAVRFRFPKKILGHHDIPNIPPCEQEFRAH